MRDTRKIVQGQEDKSSKWSQLKKYSILIIKREDSAKMVKYKIDFGGMLNWVVERKIRFWEDIWVGIEA